MKAVHNFSPDEVIKAIVATEPVDWWRDTRQEGVSSQLGVYRTIIIINDQPLDISLTLAIGLNGQGRVIFKAALPARHESDINTVIDDIDIKGAFHEHGEQITWTSSPEPLAKLARDVLEHAPANPKGNLH